jgi:hypothetical protein
MKEKQLYPVTPADEQEIQKAIEMHTQMQDELQKQN